MRATELFEDYMAWLRVNVPRAYENLAPPASRADIDKLEQALGQSIPDDLAAVLMVHNGQLRTATADRDDDDAVPCVPTLSFLSTALIEQCWSKWVPIREFEDMDALQACGATMPGAKGRVRPLYTSPGWIPLWSDPVRSDYIGLDLDPDAAGVRGQIINFGRDEERHFVCANNFTELLEILLDEVRSGRWPATTLIYDEEEGEERTLVGDVAEGSGRAWFGALEDHFFNALYKRAEGPSSPAVPVNPPSSS